MTRRRRGDNPKPAGFFTGVLWGLPLAAWLLLVGWLTA